MVNINFVDTLQTTTAQSQIKLGTRANTPDGSTWVYVKAAGVLAKGSVAVPNTVVSVDNVTSATDNQGRIVYITKASAGWTVGAYEDQYGVIDDGTGVGQTFRILTNSNDTLTLYPSNALTTALSVVDSDLTIYLEGQVIKAAVTSKLQNAVGVAQVAFASADFGWVLERGVGTVLAGEVLVVGGGFCTGDDTTGQVLKNVATESAITAQIIGRALVANAAADQTALVFIDIL